MGCDTLNWPGVRQLIKYVRMVDCKGKTTYETHFAVTNLPRSVATVDDLLSWRRGRWGIENRTFHVRDVAFQEDHSQIRTGQLPRVMAAFRNAAIDAIRGEGRTNITAALWENALKVNHMLAKLGIVKN